MLNFFSKRMSNFGFLLLAISLLILQFFSASFPIDLDVWQKSAPLAHLFFEIIGINFLENKFLDFAFSTPLILFQLVLVYNLLANNKNLEKHSLLITWMYLWLIHLFPAWSKFSPPLIASTILLFVLYRLDSSVESKSNQFVFTVSSLIGVSFLFWYPSVLLLAFLTILLFQYNAIQLKRVIILCLSFSVPIIWFCFFYVTAKDGVSLAYKFSSFHISEIQLEKFTTIQIFPLGLLFLALVIGGFQTLAFSTKTAKLSRLFINSQMSLIFISLLAFFLSINKFGYSFQFLLLPFSLFLVMFINIFKRPIVAELAHIILISIVIFNFAYLTWT